jgi:hypothetical protein
VNVAKESGLEIRYESSKWGCLGCLGAVLCVAGLGSLVYLGVIVAGLRESPPSGRLPEWLFLLLWFLFSVGFVFGFGWYARYSWRRASDRSVQLSLASEGLTDHRTGELLPWSHIRDVRFKTLRAKSGIVVSAWLCIRVVTDAGEREVTVDVFGLERTPEDIAQLVQDRKAGAI